MENPAEENGFCNGIRDRALKGKECFVWSVSLGTPPAKNLKADQNGCGPWRYSFGRAIF